MPEKGKVRRNSGGVAILTCKSFVIPRFFGAKHKRNHLTAGSLVFVCVCRSAMCVLVCFALRFVFLYRLLFVCVSCVFGVCCESVVCLCGECTLNVCC